MESLIGLALGTTFLVGFAIFAHYQRGASCRDSARGPFGARRGQSVPLVMMVSGGQGDSGAGQEQTLRLRRGLPVEWLVSVAEALRWDVGSLSEALAIDCSGEPSQDFLFRLSLEESDRLLRLVGLITLVREMVERSGSPEGFRASHWLGGWLRQSCPAFGGQRPVEYLRSSDGFQLLEQTLMQMESGTYA